MIEIAIRCSTLSDDNTDWDKHAVDAATSHPFEAADGTPVDFEVFKTLGFHGRILDVGSSIGRWYPLFKNLDCEYHGIDQSLKAIETAKGDHPEAFDSFLCLDFLRYPILFHSEDFDCVFCNAFLQHFTHANKVRILDTINCILKPKGLFVMAECYHKDKPDDYTDGWTFTVKGWQNFIEQCGFESIDVRLPYFRFRKA